MFEKILIPTDGSVVARKAIKDGVAFAKEVGASVVAYYAAEPIERAPNPGISHIRPIVTDEVKQRIAERGQHYLDEVANACTTAGVACETLMTSPESPYLGIVETALNEKCDLIFMASHGRGELAALILGSVTQKVLAHSKIPVLVYR